MFYAVNLRQSTSITELHQIQVFTGTPHIFCLTTTSLTRVSVWDLGPNKYPKIAQNTWNVTLNNEISWVRRRLNAWLEAMRQTRRSWLVRLLTVHTPPPRMSQRGHSKATFQLGPRKRHVKARNLMNVVLLNAWLAAVNQERCVDYRSFKQCMKHHHACRDLS